MLCSLSGQVPQEPVVVSKNGHIYEKRLLLKYLEQNENRCPVTNEELDASSDLIDIQTLAHANKPSVNGASKSDNSVLSAEASSIPSLLSTFQNEWDAAMLETFNLKKHLEQTRQELSHALYQHDAACRVIARLNAENADLRQKLASKHTQAEDESMETPSGLSPEALATIEAKQKALAKSRKEFKKKTGPMLMEKLGDVSGWKCSGSHTAHDSSKPGVLDVSIDPKEGFSRIVTAGVDHTARIFDLKQEKVASVLKGHSKQVNSVTFHHSADLLVTSSDDKSVKVWGSDADGQYSAIQTLSSHSSNVSSASVHATGDYVLSSSHDGTWMISDLTDGRNIVQKVAHEDETALLDACFHPDGGIFSTASKTGSVDMWDLRSLSHAASFSGHATAVQTLAFADNGYMLASGDDSGVVKLWDLRKLKSVSEIDLSSVFKTKKAGGSVKGVSFDPSASHLAVACNQLHVFKEQGKGQWGVVQSWSDHKASVTAAEFAPDSTYLASTSMDRSVKLFQ